MSDSIHETQKVACTLQAQKKCTRASRKAGALVALPMFHQVPNAVIDLGSPSNNGAALVALPYGRQVANAVIVIVT
jgi:hypothetical protein